MKRVTLYKVYTEDVVVQGLRDIYTYTRPESIQVINAHEIMRDVTVDLENIPVRRVVINNETKYVAITPEAQDVLKVTAEETIAYENRIQHLRNQRNHLRIELSQANVTIKYINDEWDRTQNAHWTTRLKWLFTGVTYETPKSTTLLSRKR